MYINPNFFWIIVSLTTTTKIFAQDDFEKYFQSSDYSNLKLTYQKEVIGLYAQNKYEFIWLKDNRRLIDKLIPLMEHSISLGLDTVDYPLNAIRTIRTKGSSLNPRVDSFKSEVICMDACFHVCHDIAFGNRVESLGYNGISITSSCVDLTQVIVSVFRNNLFSKIVSQLEPNNHYYNSVKKLFNQYLTLIHSQGFEEMTVRKTNTLVENKALLIKLFHLGFIDDPDKLYTEIELKNRVQKCQQLFALLDDGKLRSTFLYELNVPLFRRLADLKNTLNFIRWSRCLIDNKEVMIVNIPSANLFLFDHGKVVGESRIIVGKKSTPTPTLSSIISEVILYPYWNVPYKIATREMLPLVKRNPAYLENNGFQVIDSRGKRISSTMVPWQSLSVNYFPYTIRQSSGCDNALGLYKLNFFNPFSVYLHDTPGKYLFNMNKRYFSHGCMRMQRANEMVHYVLKGNAIAIDTLEAKGCLLQQQPIHVPAANPLPVMVIYHTAWFDSTGSVYFYEDAYRKNKF